MDSPGSLTAIRSWYPDMTDQAGRMPDGPPFPVFQAPSPAYLIDARAIESNARLLRDVKEASGCRILLAQKAFACFPLYPLLARYLDGAASSGLFEARLAREEMGEDSEVHVYAPAYRDDEFQALLGLADVIVFNSYEQWERYRDKLLDHHLAGGRSISCGLRLNPGHSEIQVPLYDPARRDSRLGLPAQAFLKGYGQGRFEGLQGLHFHSLCEQGADVLERTLGAIRRGFGPWPQGLSWINFGGGHHITRPGYDLDLLVSLIRQTIQETGATVYLEPGEAVALDAGWLVATVLDLFRPQEGLSAILDVSAACHMPDVLEMPYRPDCYLVPSPERSGGASRWFRGEAPGVLPYAVTLEGPSCLAGDRIGSYSFASPPLPGDRLVFMDMAIYTMVKNNTFNGLALPAIGVVEQSGELRLLRQFSYDDFKTRLG